MSAITSINNTMSSAVLLPTRGRLQQVQNPERQIARIDKEIEVKEAYVKKLDDHVDLLKEQKQALVENRDAHIKLHDANIEIRDLLIESRDLDRKRIALLEESKEIDREKIRILQNTNDRLQNVIDDRNNKLRSLFNQGSRSKSAEPLHNKTLELNKLEDRKSVTLKERPVSIDEKTYKVSVLDTVFVADSKDFRTSRNKLSNQDTTIKAQIATVNAVQTKTLHSLSTQKDFSKIKTSEAHDFSQKNYLQKEKQFISEVGGMVLKTEASDQLVKNLYKVIKADSLIASGEYDEAQKKYEKIITKNGLDNKIFDKNYRPSSEQLRLASQAYMGIVDFQKRYNLDITSNSDLTASIVTTHIMDKNSVSKAEVLNMIQNQFFYPEESKEKMKKGLDIEHLYTLLDTLAKKESVLKEQSKAKDVLLEKQTMKLEHIEKQVTSLEAKTNGVVADNSAQSQAKSTDINLSKVNTPTNSNKKDVSQTPVTYRPFVATQAKTYSNDELVPNTKAGPTANALHQQVRASQQNIYDSIISKNIASNLKLSKLL